MQAIIRDARALGATLRMARTQRNLRQIDLANKVGIRQALISDLERGVAGARLDTVIKVMAALGLDLAVIPRSRSDFDPTDY